ncbi:MAG: cytochrome c-type biogenesis protein CcmH [Sphaerobacteraceae bacterium]|nr:MAG: cytochrome c-type biogenesis protein CcmH [Sphaerobacteraceae bacterium]
MKRKLIMGILLGMVVTLIPLSALADDVQMSPKALEISNNLNCPVCEGQSVRDSNAQLARDMRRIVQERLDEGYTEDEVYDYFVDRYGVGILRNPPRSGFFLTLWWAPVVGIAIGALVLGTFLTQRKKPSTSQKASSESSTPDDDQSDDLSEYEARILQDLDDNDSYRNERSDR